MKTDLTSKVYNRFSNGGTRGTETYQSFNITQLSVSLGTRLRWPDDNFGYIRRLPTDRGTGRPRWPCISRTRWTP